MTQLSTVAVLMLDHIESTVAHLLSLRVCPRTDKTVKKQGRNEYEDFLINFRNGM